MVFCWIQVLVLFEEWDSLIFLSHVFVVQFYYPGVSRLWENPSRTGSRWCWGAGPPGSRSVLWGQSGSSLLSSALELGIFSWKWFLSFTFSSYVYLHYLQCPLVILNLCCVCCRVLSLLRTVPLSAFSRLLIILTGCLLSYYPVGQLWVSVSVLCCSPFH